MKLIQLVSLQNWFAQMFPTRRNNWETSSQPVVRFAFGTRLPDFSWYNVPKRVKIYQQTTKYTHWPQNIPSVYKIYQMPMTFTTILLSKAFQNLFLKSFFCVWKNAILGNPNRMTNTWLQETPLCDSSTFKDNTNMVLYPPARGSHCCKAERVLRK
jgi:hypothetical protein